MKDILKYIPSYMAAEVHVDVEISTFVSYWHLYQLGTEEGV